MALPRQLRKRKITLAIILTIFVTFFFYLLKSLPEEKTSNVSRHTKLSKETVADLLSIIILDFEDFDNALEKTTDKLQDVLGPVPIFIISDHVPYPPVRLEAKGSARILTLENELTRNYSAGCAAQFFNTEFVLILPDASSLEGFDQIKSFISFLKFKRDTKAIAIPQTNELVYCTDFHVDLARWTIVFEKDYLKKAVFCPLVKGSHGLLMRTQTLMSLPTPFMRPFPFTFYVQAKVKSWKIRIMNSGRIGLLSKLYTDPHSKWKRKQRETDFLRAFYKSVGLKKEILPSGVSHFYGCEKHTSRCFGTVVKDMPEFLYRGRWTPPCCLRALRETAAHVFSVLEKCNVRYWLEGGTLLGAARLGDIIPWDYDVDIGIYKEDIAKCQPLLHASEDSEPFIDEKEFVWEKASEGDFLRIQYSETNHLHVDIYPFYQKDGIMTKNTWFLTHRQDVEFPETYLKPLTKINFTGIMVSAPNNVKKFLEFKFGEGVIENPRYPNLQKPLNR